MSERFIAAVEISSSKIIAAVGKTSGNGLLEIIAIEQETEVEGIRYGIIQNLEETAMAVSRIFTRLEQRSGISPRKIKKVIVGLGGRSLRNIPREVSLNLPEDSEITEETLNTLREQALRGDIDNTLEIIDAVPRLYRIGNTETTSPKGMVGNNISAVYDLIVCRPELKRNIKRTITDKLHMEVAGFVVTAMATGHLILTPDEKRLGCMLVDMGAETTTVTIYTKGALKYFATLPMGGRNISHDITSLGVLEARAEDIKKTSGDAMADPASQSLNINGIKLSDISNLVVARCEEIVANIVEQISYAGLKESELTGGIICIGGASKMKGINQLLTMQSDLPVREGKLPEYVKIDDPKAHNMVVTEVASVLYAGATLSEGECLEVPQVQGIPVNGVLPFEEENEEEHQEEKPRTRSKFMESLSRRIGSLGNIFGGNDDDSELI